MSQPIVTTAQFHAVYSVANPAAIEFINKYAANYNINTAERMAAFLATCFVESTGFNRTVEKLNYSSDRLYAVFRSKFVSLAQAKSLVAEGQEAIANYVYGNINGNRGRNTNDGWNYRGRGGIQTTGLANYEVVNKHTGIDCVNHPELLEQIENSVLAAMVFWNARGCNELSDKIPLSTDGYGIRGLVVKAGHIKPYVTNPEIVALRKRVNGGILGLNDVGSFFEGFLKQFK